MTILNPGFETYTPGDPPDFDNWTEVEGLGSILANTSSHSGTYAVWLEFISGEAYVYQDITVVPLMTYDFSFWTNSDLLRDGQYGVYDLSNSAWIISKRTAASGGTYVKISDPFSTPVGCSAIRIYLYSSPIPAPLGAYARFDDVSLEIKKIWSFNKITITVEKDSQDYPKVRMGILDVLGSTKSLIHYGGTEGYFRDIQFVIYSGYENQFEPLIGSGYYMFVSDQDIEGYYIIVSAQSQQLQALNYDTVVYRVNVVLRKQ